MEAVVWFRPEVRSGFTLIEIMLALVLTAIGVLAVLGTTAQATRTLDESRRVAKATEVGMRRIERLRDLARATSPRCTDPGLASGTANGGNGITERWAVDPVGPARTVLVVVNRPTRGAIQPDTFASILRCD